MTNGLLGLPLSLASSACKERPAATENTKFTREGPRPEGNQESLLLCVLCVLCGCFVHQGNAAAQSLEDVQSAQTPLVLRSQGSFYVGGEKVQQTKAELGNLGPGGHITVNQMYVRYMVPQGG